MKTIYKNHDDLYYVVKVSSPEEESLSPSDLDALSIEFYTDGKEKVIKTLEDISEEGIVHVEASELAVLGDGPLKARFHIAIEDTAWSDGTYDQVAERLTGYFLKTLKA